MTCRTTTRFAILTAAAAVTPLLIFGIVSLAWVRTVGHQSALDRNLEVAEQTAARVEQYLQSSARVLRTVASNLRRPALEPRHITSLLQDTVIDVPEFRELTLRESFGRRSRTIASSRIGGGRLQASLQAHWTPEPWHVSDVRLDGHGWPTATMTVPVDTFAERPGYLVGELSLQAVWRLIDGIRVGREGFAAIVTENGQVIAHGNAEVQSRLGPTGAGRRPAHAARRDERPVDDPERTTLRVAAPVGGGTGWSVIVEQPAHDAYALARDVGVGLAATVALVLLTALVLGYHWGRSFLRPIMALKRGTEAIAAGRLDERVDMSGRDELHQLGEGFNVMADRLARLEEDIRRQERHAMFGRIAGGLVHDIAQPIQNLSNSCRLIMKLHDDEEYRDTFQRTVEREIATLMHNVDHLRNVVRPQPLERVPVNINQSLAELVESIEPLAVDAGVTLEARLSPDEPFVDGDAFALARVHRNLITNAIEATSPGGTVWVATTVVDECVEVAVADTGHGIPKDRLAAIFEDFKTTKRRGLGLGLAISRKIVAQLDGTIAVTSALDRGTTFVVRLPLGENRVYPAAVVAS